MWMVNTSLYHHNHQQLFRKSCVTVSYNKNRLFTAYINNLYLWSRADSSALPAVPASAVLRLWPPTEVVCLLAVLCSVYVNIWLFFVAVYTNQRSISLDYPSQDRLPNWLSDAPQPLCSRRMHACTPSYCIRNADSVASSQSAPSWVLYCLCPESGLFWAII